MARYNLFAACLLNLRAKLTALTRLYHEPGEKPNISGPTQLRNQIRDLKRLDYCQRAFLNTTERPVDTYYPQSNGLAEAYVKVVKNMMKKAQKCKVRFNDMMYQYRISPVAGKKESPIELLEQRRPRTNMPHLGKGNPRGDLKTKTHNYPIGITVMYRGGPDPDSSLHGTWYPARITSHLEEPRSYLLENNYSKIVRRTEQHIRPYFTPQRP